MRFSVVICTFNRADALRTTLGALRHQRGVEFEVVVVNGPSTDHTATVVAEWSDRVKAIDNPLANLSVSRNLGIAAAAGDIVAFVDDDGIPEFDWLAGLAEAFAEPDVAGVGGCVFDHTGHDHQFRFSAASRLGEPMLSDTRPFDDLCVPGAYRFPYLQGTNAAFRRSVLAAVGGFDETYEYYLDETDLCARIVDAGWRLRQLDGAHVHHKFLASSMRTDDRIVTRWYPIIKNLTYFGYRHALETDGEDAILAKASAELALRVAETAEHERRGRLPTGAAERIRLEGEEAIAVGSAAGRAAGTGPLPPRRLGDTEFLPFRTLRSPDDPACDVHVVVTATWGADAAGGIARFLSDAARTMAGRGTEVRVVTRSPDQSRVDLEDGVWVHRLEVPDDGVPDEPITARLAWSAAVADEVERIGTFRRVTSVYGPVWDAEVLESVRRPGPPVVAFVATPYAVVRHLSGNTDALTPFEVFVFDSEREILASAEVLHADSDAVVATIEEGYGPLDRSRVVVARLGVVDTPRTPAPPDPDADRPLRVLHVGRLEPRKGVDVLLRAIEIVAPHHRTVEFLLAGADNPAVSDIRQLWTAEHGADPWASRVTFLGNVDDALLEALYADASVVVVPSRYESFGLTVVEGMRHGCAVVASAAGAIPEIVRDGVDGLLVPPGDAAALAIALDTVLRDPTTRNSLAAAGRARYEAEFTIDAAVDRVERVLAASRRHETAAAS